MKCVTFKLGNQLFAFNILNIKEIVKKYSIKAIPGVSSIIEGMMNLRGEIITVLSLKKRLKIKEKQSEHKDIVIVIYKGEKFGLLIDEVLEVVEFEDSEIEKGDNSIFKIEEDFVSGLTKINGLPVMILNVEKVLDFI
jgi:purine-binding chemotaxis protein CheW